MRSPSQTTLLIKGTRGNSCSSLSTSAFQFPASPRNYSNKPVRSSHGNQGHLTLLILQSLAPTAPNCSLPKCNCHAALCGMQCLPPGCEYMWLTNCSWFPLSSIRPPVFRATTVTLGQKSLAHQWSEQEVIKKWVKWGNSLAVQWLGLGAFTAVAWVQSPVGELKSCKLWGVAKKKKKVGKMDLSKHTLGLISQIWFTENRFFFLLLKLLLVRSSVVLN